MKFAIPFKKDSYLLVFWEAKLTKMLFKLRIKGQKEKVWQKFNLRRQLRRLQIFLILLLF
jgi:hypothetical protein